MDIRNCRRCGKMFSYTGAPICLECRQQDEEDFVKVKKYLYDNPGSSMQEISEACEVNVEKIMRFLREGRLEVKQGSGIILKCESCGASIKSGRLCAECSKKLERDINKATGVYVQKTKEEDEEDLHKHKGGMKYLRSE